MNNKKLFTEIKTKYAGMFTGYYLSDKYARREIVVRAALEMLKVEAEAGDRMADWHDKKVAANPSGLRRLWK